MLVQIDTKRLQQMEQQMDLLTQIATVAVYKRKGKTLRITPKDLQAVKETGIDLQQEEDGTLVLKWHRSSED